MMRQTTGTGISSSLRNAASALLALVAAVAAVAAPMPARAQGVDVTPPALVSFSINPTMVDVSAGTQIVSFTVHMTDDLAGFSSAFVTVRSPSNGQVFNVGASQVISGTRLDGTVVVNVPIPQFAEQGTWNVINLQLADLVVNFVNLSQAVLQAAGFPTQFDVVSTSDTQAPNLTGLAITPSAIDVSPGAQAVTVDMQLTDNLSGVAFAPCVAGTIITAFFSVTVRSPSGAQNRFIAAAGMTLTSGTRADGSWRGTFNMPQYSEPGTWTVQNIQLRDCANNGRTLFTANLVALGVQTTFTVTSSPADLLAPVLTSLSFSPITINTSTGSQLVNVQLGIVDDLAGADFSRTTPQLFFFEGGVQFRSPSGVQARGVCCTSFTLMSGTPLNGVWQANIFFPQFSEDGTWFIDFLNIKDATRNIRTFNTAQLQAMGFPTTLVVVRPSLVGDGTVDAAGGTVIDDTFGDRASVTFPPGALSGTTTVAIDVFEEPLQIPNPTGFSGPGTLFVNIELTPQPTFPLAPPGMQIVLPLANAMVPGTVLFLYKVDTVTGQLVPAKDVSGNDATGTVAADGITAVFPGIAGLSTVVGLIPEEIAVAIDIRPGTANNTINLAARGALPVAILSTTAFDARTVIPESVKLAGASARLRGNGLPLYSLEDVNGDGLIDMLLQFNVDELDLLSHDVEAELTGMTTGGTPIRGKDSIRIVP